MPMYKDPRQAVNVVPSSQWAVDLAPANASGPTFITMADNATYDLASGDGLIFVHNNDTGTAGVFMTGGGLIEKLSDLGAGFSITVDTANKVNVYYNAGVYRIQNKTGAAVHLYVGGIRTRFLT